MKRDARANEQKRGFTQSALLRGIRGRLQFSGVGLFLVLIAICIALSLSSRYFFTLNNLFSIGLNVAVVGVSAIGSTMVIVSGGLDLSVESVIACTGVVIGLVYQAGIPIGFAIFIGFMVGPFVGLINGLLITKAKINAVIVTLGTMSIVRGAGLP